MKKIIVPIDYSDTSEFLAKSAATFAKDIDAEIHLIHVTSTDNGFVISDMGFQYLPQIEQNELKHELGKLHKLQQIIAEQGIKCSHILKQGNASEVILKYVEEKNADYLLIGSHGRSGVYDLFVGSLTKEFTKNSPIPVLVIPCHD